MEQQNKIYSVNKESSNGVELFLYTDPNTGMQVTFEKEKISVTFIRYTISSGKALVDEFNAASIIHRAREARGDTFLDLTSALNAGKALHALGISALDQAEIFTAIQGKYEEYLSEQFSLFSRHMKRAEEYIWAQNIQSRYASESPAYRLQPYDLTTIDASIPEKLETKFSKSKRPESLSELRAKNAHELGQAKCTL